MKREMQVFALMALLVVVYFTGGDLLNPDFTKEPETTESPAKEVAVAKAPTEKEKQVEKDSEPVVAEEKEVTEAPPIKTAVPEVKDTSIVEEAPNSEKTDAEEQKAKELAARRKAEAAEAAEAERIQLAKERQKALQAQKVKAATPATPAVDYTVEPETTMDEWADLSDEAKRKLVEHSVQYVLHSQKANNTPVEARSTTEEFIQAVNDRYAEIDTLTDSFERHRMMGTTVAGQISIMGNRFEFTF